jgi:hypothetical protein
VWWGHGISLSVITKKYILLVFQKINKIRTRKEKDNYPNVLHFVHNPQDSNGDRTSFLYVGLDFVKFDPFPVVDIEQNLQDFEL